MCLSVQPVTVANCVPFSQLSTQSYVGTGNLFLPLREGSGSPSVPSTQVRACYHCVDASNVTRFLSPSLVEPSLPTPSDLWDSVAACEPDAPETRYDNVSDTCINAVLAVEYRYSLGPMASSIVIVI